MSISRRVRKETERIADEIQARLFLSKGKKISKNDIINKALFFAKKNINDFLDFIVTTSGNNDAFEDPFVFILASSSGGTPEDYCE